MTKCNFCERLLVNVYVADTSDKNRKHVSIGKFCLNCDTVRERTKFLIGKKQEIAEKKKEEEEYAIKTKSKPEFRENKEICSECRAINGIKKIKHNEGLWIEFDEGRGELVCQKNHRYLECKCSKCGNKWTKGLGLPKKPKYLLPTNMTKEKLRLAFLRVGSQNIHIPNKFKKMAIEIHKELSAERQAKETRELEERAKKG